MLRCRPQDFVVLKIDIDNTPVCLQNARNATYKRAKEPHYHAPSLLFQVEEKLVSQILADEDLSAKIDEELAPFSFIKPALAISAVGTFIVWTRACVLACSFSLSTTSTKARW